MPKRILGRSKVEVSLLSFGVLAVKNEEIYRRAVDLGVTYFHFAADQNTRKLLAPDKHNYQAITALRPVRNRLVVSYMTIKRDTKSIMLQDLDEFLQASGFGHLDFWYLCCPSPGQWNDFCEAVGEARRAGKVRFAAISTHALPEDMERLTAPGSPIDAVMLTYNFTSSAEDRERVAKLHAAGLGIVSMKPLAGRFYEVTTARPDAALRWLAADSRVHTIPVAMEKLEQLDQNRAALRWPLSDQDKQDLVAHLDFVSPRF
ncbi:MAG TPA: aldo/keto reductase, partial [Clostridia bacterium]|nr:aldo/keto reductase [Clostridia bacterium]